MQEHLATTARSLRIQVVRLVVRSLGDETSRMTTSMEASKRRTISTTFTQTSEVKSKEVVRKVVIASIRTEGTSIRQNRQVEKANSIISNNDKTSKHLSRKNTISMMMIHLAEQSSTRAPGTNVAPPTSLSIMKSGTSTELRAGIRPMAMTSGLASRQRKANTKTLTGTISSKIDIALRRIQRGEQSVRQNSASTSLDLTLASRKRIGRTLKLKCARSGKSSCRARICLRSIGMSNEGSFMGRTLR